MTNISNLDRLLVALTSGSSLEQYNSLLFNRLEEAVLPYVDSVREVKEDFKALGVRPLMSGSGSTVFALTPTLEQAKNLAEKINKQGQKVFVAHFGGTKNENN